MSDLTDARIAEIEARARAGSGADPDDTFALVDALRNTQAALAACNRTRLIETGHDPDCALCQLSLCPKHQAYEGRWKNAARRAKEAESALANADAAHTTRLARALREVLDCWERVGKTGSPYWISHAKRGEAEAREALAAWDAALAARQPREDA